jgi:hypothetical protein
MKSAYFYFYFFSSALAREEHQLKRISTFTGLRCQTFIDATQLDQRRGWMCLVKHLFGEISTFNFSIDTHRKLRFWILGHLVSDSV